MFIYMTVRTMSPEPLNSDDPAGPAGPGGPGGPRILNRRGEKTQCWVIRKIKIILNSQPWGWKGAGWVN